MGAPKVFGPIPGVRSTSPLGFRGSLLHNTNSVVICVGNVYGAVAIDDATMRAIHAGLGCGAVVAACALLSAGDGGHVHGFDVNLADAVILTIDDEDVAIGVAADTFGAIENRVFGRAVIAFVAAFAGA